MNRILASFHRTALQSTLSISLGAALLFATPLCLLAGGSGTSAGDPFTALDVTNTMNAGTLATPIFYQISSGVTNGITSTSELRIGDSGLYNTLTITSGGTLTNTDAYIGQGLFGTPTAGGNNFVLLVGAGENDTTTTWKTNGTLAVGLYGSENTLSILSGADVTVTGETTIGGGSIDTLEQSSNTEDGYGYGNKINVTGAGSTLTLRNDSLTYQTLYVGKSGCSNELNITGGGAVKSGDLFIGYGSINYGATGSYNSVTVGGTTAGDTSTLTVDGMLYVGTDGSNNTLTIQSGAKVTTTGGGVIGSGEASYSSTIYSTNATNGLGYGNSVMVTGSGSEWSLYNGSYKSLTVGYFGCSNSLSVTNGGKASCSDLTIGYGNTTYGSGVTGGHNDVVVGATGTTGDTSRLEVHGVLNVGLKGSNNTLTIQSGATVTTTGYGYIGFGADGTYGVYSTNADNGYGYGNSVTVTGEGSLWSLYSGSAYTTLYAGHYGCSNSLFVTDGGKVECKNLVIGTGFLNNDTLGGYNSVTVGAEGTSNDGSSIAMSQYLNVGRYGSHNTLTVQSGASVTIASTGYIGGDDLNCTATDTYFSHDNKVVVKGSGSTLTLKTGSTYQTLNVGYYGSSNSLQISGGGKVSNGAAYIGYKLSSVGNVAVVSGSGSAWRNDGTLHVGNSATGGEGSLIIDNGALVKATSIAFGTSTTTTISLTGDAMIGIAGLLTTDAALTSITANTICLGIDSYLAVSGDLTSVANAEALATLLAGLTIYDSASSTWVRADSAIGTALIAYTYVDGTLVTSSGLTDGAYEDLMGYTVFTANNAVPEPATYALFGGLGALLLAFYRRKKSIR